MEIKSLGIKIDLQINRFSGDVIDKGEYIVVHMLEREVKR
jgi:hypothetical protein